MKNKNIAIIILGLILTGGILLFFNFQRKAELQKDLNPSPIKAIFTCKDGKSIEAVFAGSKVSLVLSDGRKLELDQTLAASGARYANKDETLVFWNKGDTAFIEEKEKTTYSDCLQK